MKDTKASEEKSTTTETTKKVEDPNPLVFIPIRGLTAFIQIPGILIFSILGGYFMGRFGFNFLFLIILAHISCYAFYRRVRFYNRTLDQLCLEKKNIDSIGVFETVEWMNHITKKFWEVSEQKVSSIIFNEVNNVLKVSASKKAFSIKLAEITLGSRPPIIEKISFIESSPEKLMLEVAVSFIPIMASEEILKYFKYERTHWNTHIGTHTLN